LSGSRLPAGRQAGFTVGYFALSIPACHPPARWRAGMAGRFFEIVDESTNGSPAFAGFVSPARRHPRLPDGSDFLGSIYYAYPSLHRSLYKVPMGYFMKTDHDGFQ